MGRAWLPALVWLAAGVARAAASDWQVLGDDGGIAVASRPTDDGTDEIRVTTRTDVPVAAIV